jgi:hypothetical protein
MQTFLSELFPLLYGACFLLLLVQAFRVMGKGFRAASHPGQGRADPPTSLADRTGRLTIHPELLDSDGQLTQEDLLTVRFSGDNEQPAFPGDAG